MPYISSIFVTLLGLLLGFLILIGMFATSPFWSLFSIIYMVVAIIAGWAYAFSRDRIAAWIHALLMFGISGFCCVCEFLILGNHSVSFGHGADANPVGGILYGVIYVVGFLDALIAFVALIGGVGVVIHLLRNQKDKK